MSKSISEGTVHELPSDLRQALSSDPQALALWEDITPLARNEWICWTISVKTPAKREEHVSRVVSELKEGMRRPCCWPGCMHRTDKALSPSQKYLQSRRAGKVSETAENTECRRDGQEQIPAESKAASEEIDAIIAIAGDWRGQTLSLLRKIIKKAAPALVEEVKWKKPSKPEGVPVWSHNGILCMADTLKNAVRLNFPKGASIVDPEKLFNTRLDSKTLRAIDFHEGDAINEPALEALVVQAVRANTEK